MSDKEKVSGEEVEVVGYRSIDAKRGGGWSAHTYPLNQSLIDGGAIQEPLMTVAQHTRIVEALRERLNIMSTCADNYSQMFEEASDERDQLRAEVERKQREIDLLWSDRRKDAALIAELRAQLAQHPVVPEGWRVMFITSAVVQQGDRWEVYDPNGSGGVVNEDDVKDWAVSGLLDALAAAPAPVQAEPASQSAAARDVLAERQRQISAEGWTPEHDDEHGDGSMALAASCYACASAGFGDAARDWPWSDDWFKPSSPRRDLIKAGALILAEIERIDRAALPPVPEVKP